MKKISAIILILCMAVSLNQICFAKTVDDKDFGITFTISDNWLDYSGDGMLKFYNKNNTNEGVGIEATEYDWAYSLGFADEATLKAICDDRYSDYNIAKDLSSENNTLATVKTESVLSKFEWYGGIQYYRYEKAYTASAFGYRTTPFYETVFVTAKNGKAYFISYQRDDMSNNFAEVAAMLNSISYENGQIKIKVGGQQIFPDSEPVIVEGRTLVPIRAVAEKMGYDVSWDAGTGIVTLTSQSGMSILHFQINSNEALKNYNEIINLDVPAMIISDRTYLPLRAVAEAMNAEVNWNSPEKTVEIN